MRPRPAHRPSSLGALFALTAALLSQGSLAGAQQRTPAAAPEPPTPRETVGGGTVITHPLTERQGAPPLPVPRIGALEAGRDVELEARSGDPFFLGFAAGAYHPPADERIDPELLAQVRASYDDGRPAEETWAFVMFAERMTSERVAELEARGLRVLEFHPYYCLKVALPTGAIEAVSALPFVRWIGVPKTWQKRHPLLQRELEPSRPGERLEVYVNVYDSDLNPSSTSEPVGRAAEREAGGLQVEVEDPSRLPRTWRSNGWQQRALEARGVEVRSYDDRLRAFRARALPEELDALVELDFVQFVEPVVPSAPLHDESMPMTNADAGRAEFDGGTSQAVVVGVVDSGMDNGHTGLNHFFGAGWDLTGSSGGPWADNCGHGSHVTGTVLGDPISTLDGYTGAAPGLGWGSSGRVYNVKLWDSCASFSVDMTTLLGILHTDHVDGSGNTTPRPHVINHSWGSVFPGPYFGTEVDARALDLDVYIYDQQHVFAAGNLGSGGQTLTLQASAKNTLSVGNVNTYLNGTAGYPGNLWGSSSRGPTGDLRWGPNLCAPGVDIRSVDANTTSGYTDKTGTSMAAPHVTGIAAQLMDRHPFLRYNAATLSAVMMAGSITKDSTILSQPSFASDHHLNTYGTGRIDAFKARGGNVQQAMYFWGFAQGDSGWAQLDFPVGPGATQVTIVMHYKERAASSGASQALVNDLDMWIDVAPFEPGGNTGEYFLQQSTRDNTEVRILDNPTVADWRVKVYPESVAPGLFSFSNVGVCAIVTYGDVTPDTTLSVTAAEAYVQPNEVVEVTARVFNPSYVASAVFLEVGNTGSPILGAEVTLEDGVVTDLVGNEHDGRKVLLGDIAHQTQREVRWTTRWGTEGVKSFSASASADNMEGGFDVDQATVTVDGTPPQGPSDLTSTSHQVGLPSCDLSLELAWTAATDALSGLAGYRIFLDHEPATEVPQASLNVDASATTYTANLFPGAWYVHLRAQDNAGNWAPTQHAGPFLLAPGSAASYCTAAPNSAGPGALMGHTGSFSVDANDFVLTCSGLPSGLPCLFFYGPNETQVPFGNGFRCVGGTILRLPVTNSGTGVASWPLDFGGLPTGGDIAPGSTWKFQNWYRDPAGGGAGYNLSNGLSVTFCQ